MVMLLLRMRWFKLPKELLIDTKGTGEMYIQEILQAARYIEARLTLLLWKWFSTRKLQNGANLMMVEIMNRLTCL